MENQKLYETLASEVNNSEQQQSIRKNKKKGNCKAKRSSEEITEERLVKEELKQQRKLEKLKKEVEYDERITSIKDNAPTYTKLTLKENLEVCTDELAYLEAKEFLGILHHKLPSLKNMYTNSYFRPKIAITQLMRDYGGAVLTRYYESAELLDSGWAQSHNVYTSVHVHNQFQRKIATTTHLNTFFADLDFYKTNENATYDSVNKAINDLVKMKKLPEPTLRVNSGRGMQLYWVLDEYIPLQTKCTYNKNGKQNIQHLPTYSTITYDLIQMNLANVLACFNSDPKALLKTQLLRLPGSRHGKNDNPVTFEKTGGYYSLAYLHDFYYQEIENARPLPLKENLYITPSPDKVSVLTPFPSSTTSQKNKSLKTSKTSRKPTHTKSLKTMLNGRLSDYLSIAHVHKKLNFNAEDLHRKSLIYCAMVDASNLFDYDEATNYIDTLNNAFYEPLPNYYINYQFKKIYSQCTKSPIKIKNSTIFSKITLPKELYESLEPKLKVLITAETKEKRRKQKYLNKCKTLGKKTNQEKLEHYSTEIQNFIEKERGLYTVKNIAEVLNVCERHVRRILKKLCIKPLTKNQYEMKKIELFLEDYPEAIYFDLNDLEEKIKVSRKNIKKFFKKK